MNDIKVIYASQIGAKLDSNVYSGGGTDDTVILQSVLDKAIEWGMIHLIMDGAALVRGLNIHSNTTIECMNKDCGFFLAEQSNRSIISNYNWDFETIHTKNITLIGGTYNQDCKNQLHHIPNQELNKFAFGNDKWIFGFEFYGVENLTLRDLTIRNQRTFAFMAANWKHINIENVWIALPDRMANQNQDGFHFWGPGQFLNIRNVGGQVGDDFMNIGPDEGDCVSSITDVIIDGVFLDNADQGIRFLSRGSGRLDRVIVRNVTGTYNSFGFYINPWFPGETYGNVGNIIFENIDLRQTKPLYEYTPPFLFRLGGNIECATFRNIYHHHPIDNRSLFQIGIPFYDQNFKNTTGTTPMMESLLFDGIHIVENDDSALDAEYLQIKGPIGQFLMRNVEVIRPKNIEPKGTMIKTFEGCKIDTMILSGIHAEGMDAFLTAEEGSIETLNMHDTSVKNMKRGFLTVKNDVIKNIE